MAVKSSSNVRAKIVRSVLGRFTYQRSRVFYSCIVPGSVIFQIGKFSLTFTQVGESGDIKMHRKENDKPALRLIHSHIYLKLIFNFDLRSKA